MKKFFLTFLTALLTSAAGFAETTDLPGSKDPVGLKRYDGTRITFYQEKAFSAYTLPLGKFSARNVPTEKGTYAKSLPLEGKLTQVSYVSNDPTRTVLEVARNYQAELASQGWEVLWEGTDKELGDMRRLFDKRPLQTFTLTNDGKFLAAKKGSTHLALFIATFKSGSTPSAAKPTVGAPVIALDIIESAAMEEKMVVVKAAEMASQLAAAGGTNLYGFYFDTGSAALKEESAPTLDEMEKLLTTAPELRLLVVGHTDTVGDFEGNLELSRKRAAAVVAAISKRVPSATTRLQPSGVGYQCPIASNENEAGRSKNRRVALVSVGK